MGFFFIQCHVIFTIAEPSNLKSDEKGGEETESGSSGKEGPSFSVRRVLQFGNSSMNEETEEKYCKCGDENCLQAHNSEEDSSADDDDGRNRSKRQTDDDDTSSEEDNEEKKLDTNVKKMKECSVNVKQIGATTVASVTSNVVLAAKSATQRKKAGVKQSADQREEVKERSKSAVQPKKGRIKQSDEEREELKEKSGETIKKTRSGRTVKKPSKWN